MRKSLLMLSVAMSLIGSVAHAGITNGSVVVNSPTVVDLSKFDLFNSDPHTYAGQLHQYNQFNVTTDNGIYGFSGDGTTFNQDVVGIAGGTNSIFPNYSLVIGANGSDDVRGAPAQKLTLLWETVDDYNYVTFVGLNGNRDTIWGSQLGVYDHGTLNALVSITMNYKFNEVIFGSIRQNSFEFAGGRDFLTSVPETPTLLMFGLGFIALGLTTYRSQKNRLAPAI